MIGAPALQSREMRAAAVGAIAVGAYMILILGSGLVGLADFGRLIASYLEGSFSLWLVLGTVWLIARLYRHRPLNGVGPGPFRVIADAFRERWERDRLVSLFWPPLLFGSLLASFNAFKQEILPLAGFSLDPLFARLDRALFLGNDPWQVTHALFPSINATWLLDTGYHAWFAPMSCGVLLCAWTPASTYRLRTQYLLSYITIWIGIGSVLAFALPAAGPCFYNDFGHYSASFAELNRQLALSHDVSASAAIKDHLLQLYGSHQLVVGAGISAMPSVHNALAVLFVLAAFGINRYLGYVMGAYAVMIWIGSIHLGWHYAIDGLAAAVLTFGIWRFAGRLADRLAQAPAAAELAPAAA